MSRCHIIGVTGPLQANPEAILCSVNTRLMHNQISGCKRSYESIALLVHAVQAVYYRQLRLVNTGTMSI